MSETQTQTHELGDVVIVNPDAGFPKALDGKRFVVTDLPKGARGVNYKAAPCDADGNRVAGQGVRGPGWSLLPFSEAAAVATVVEYVPNPPTGSVVVPKPGQIPDGIYVVIGETDATRVRITKIGGDGGRYWRAISRNLTVLDPGKVSAVLQAHAWEDES